MGGPCLESRCCRPSDLDDDEARRSCATRRRPRVDLARGCNRRAACGARLDVARGVRRPTRSGGGELIRVDCFGDERAVTVRPARCLGEAEAARVTSWVEEQVVVHSAGSGVMPGFSNTSR